MTSPPTEAAGALDPESRTPAAGSNPLAIVLAGVWRYRWLVVLATGLGIPVGLFNSLIIPNQYRSVGKLFVKPGIRDMITPEAAFSGATATAASYAGGREAVQTELQVLSAPQLFDKVVQRLGVDTVLAPYDPLGTESGPVAWHTKVFHAFQSWWFASDDSGIDSEVAVDRSQIAALTLENSVSIAPEPGASVISFSYVAHSPDIARRVVNAVLEAALEVHREVFDTMSSLGAIEEEMKSAEKLARDAEKVLREFRVTKGIYAYDSQRDTLLSDLGELNREADKLDLEVQRKSAEREVVLAQSKSEPKERMARGSDAPALNPNYGSLAAHLLKLQEMELSIDLAKGELLGPEYQRRKDIVTTAMAVTRGRLEKEGVQLKLDGVSEENPHYARLAQTLDELDVSLKGLASQKEHLEALRTTRKEKLAEFEALSPALRALELDAQQKRTRADRAIDAVVSMKTVQRLEQLNLSSVRIMHGGTFEPDKIAPRRGQKVVSGALGGAAIGIGLALLLAFRDPRVRTRLDLRQLGIPAAGLLQGDRGGRLVDQALGSLPSGLDDASGDIVRFWASVPYDRRATEGLKVAFLPSGAGGDAGRAAATFAIGLAVYGGERVVYVSCAPGATWLATRLALPDQRGWTDVLAGNCPLEQAIAATSVPGLHFLAFGSGFDENSHAMAGPAFVALLDRLSVDHRFIIVDLPDLEDRPEARSVLGVVDGVELVVRAGQSKKVQLRDAIAAVRTAGTRLLGAVLQSET